MKKFLLAGIALFVLGNIAHAGSLFRSYGFTHSQYETITSSCMTNITWDRRVQAIEIIRKSSHTLYIDFFEVRSSSVTDGTWTGNPAATAYALDRTAGMLAPVYDLNRSTTIAPNFGRDIFKVESNDFSVWVSTDENTNTPDIEINAWGW